MVICGHLRGHKPNKWNSIVYPGHVLRTCMFSLYNVVRTYTLHHFLEWLERVPDLSTVIQKWRIGCIPLYLSNDLMILDTPVWVSGCITMS